MPEFDPGFDHVYVATATGDMLDTLAGALAAPDVTNDPDGDVIVSPGWSVLTGHTGQYGYRGAVMHPSEQWGEWAVEALTDQADAPDVAYVAFAIVEVRDDDGSYPDSPIGWAVAYRQITQES